MTAVEEPVDRFFGDRAVRVALPAAVVGELAQHPLLDLEPVSAGVTQSDQVGDQVRQRRLRHRAHPARSRSSDVLDVQRATAQPFDVEPQVVGLGRVARGVSQHGRHHRHRRAVADHGNGQRAAQGMHPADLARRELDPGAGSVSRQPGGDRRGAPERVERVTVLDEHLRAGRLGPAASDVVDDRPADVVEQRQAQRPARLVLDDRDLLRPPVEVAQFEATQIRDPQAQPGGRQDHRVVAFAGGGLAIDPGQHPADLVRGPQVRLGLVTDVPVWRQPIRQTTRCPARRGQEAQEVGQARPHGRDGLASQSTLTQQEARHVPHAERREIIDAHLDQVGQEPAGRPVLRDHGRLGVAATTARSEVVVPQRAELRGTTVLRRDHRPVNVDRPASQHVRHQHHRPANRLDSPVFDRFTQ